VTDNELLEAIRECVRAEFDNLMIRSSEPDAFQKTEQALRHYHDFRAVVNDKQIQIDEIREHGAPHTSRDIVLCVGEAPMESGTVHGTSVEIIEALEEDIKYIQCCVDRIACAIDALEGNPDLPMVKDYYWFGYTGEELAAKYGTSIPTALKRKNAVVRQIALYLFPEDVIKELIS
jgi:hypothetical protein